jgi:hypothetical protein
MVVLRASLSESVVGVLGPSLSGSSTVVAGLPGIVRPLPPVLARLGCCSRPTHCDTLLPDGVTKESDAWSSWNWNAPSFRRRFVRAVATCAKTLRFV